MFRHIIIALFLALGLAACQQDQNTLKFGPATVFEDRFNDDIFALSHDDGSEVQLKSIRPTAGSGIRGSHGSTGNDQDIFNFGGCGIFGCNSNPWSYWAGYSNYTHSWNPYITRNVTIQFRQQMIYTTQFAPEDSSGCWEVTLESQHRIRALRGRSAHSLAPLTVEGNYSNSVRVQIGSDAQFPGTLTLALEEDPYQGCNFQPNWWDYSGSSFIWPGCGGQRTYARLRMKGTVSRCGIATTSVAGGEAFELDLTPYINSNLSGTYYQMPYFALPASQDRLFYITGRVMDYNQQNHYWGWAE